MPRYYFVVTDGRELVDDDNEVDLPGDDVARDYAEQLARNLATAGADWRGWSVEVTNEADLVIAVVPISPTQKY
jgi:hypothetical protein